MCVNSYKNNSKTLIMSNLIRPTQQLRLLAFVGLVSVGGVGAMAADF